MHVHDVGLLACPETRSPLVFRGTNLELQVQDGVLLCPSTGVAWGVEAGVPRLYRDGWRQGADAGAADRLDRAPRFADPAFAAVTWLAGGLRAADLRQAVVEHLRLPALAGRPRARVLEVNVGTGGNIEPILDNAPAGTHLELWGTDLSMGALAWARSRVADNPEWFPRLSLFLADPHHLPFADGSFDRVLMVGRVDCLRDQPLALAELCRVCAADGELLLVDKQPDPARPPSALGRVVLRRVGAGAAAPQLSPRRALPSGCRDVEEGQLSRAHYWLRARPPRR